MTNKNASCEKLCTLCNDLLSDKEIKEERKICEICLYGTNESAAGGNLTYDLASKDGDKTVTCAVIPIEEYDRLKRLEENVNKLILDKKSCIDSGSTRSEQRILMEIELLESLDK